VEALSKDITENPNLYRHERAKKFNVTQSANENTNGKIQVVMTKMRGFINFERFKTNTLFYFGNLKLFSQKYSNTQKQKSFLT